MKKVFVALLVLTILLVLGCQQATDNPSVIETPPFLSAFKKVSMIDVVPLGHQAVIDTDVDFPWSVGEDVGVFIANRKVTLSPYAIGQYEVTQELYTAVMGTNLSSFSDSPADGEVQKLRPVGEVLWFDIIAFCNELTKKTMKESDCVYYSDEDFLLVYTKEDAENQEDVYYNAEKKGYRLPTEAEWEFAARGGDTKEEDWDYPYSGASTEKSPGIFEASGIDEALNDFAWYLETSNEITHEVGKSSPNRLNIYDMSGNVSEWCFDFDSTIKAEAVENPCCISSFGVFRVIRGGSCLNESYSCAVSSRMSKSQYDTDIDIGFRLARSL